MKKIILVFMIMLSVLSLISCNNKKEESVSILVPNGIPYLSLGNLIGDSTIQIESVMGASNLQSALLSGSHDIVVAPINLGAKLISAGKANYKLAFVLTSNNVFLVTSKSSSIDVNDINSLALSNIYGFGEAGIPGQMIKYLFVSNGKDSSIDFTLSSSSEVLATYNTDELNDKVLMISEPELSKLVNMNGNNYNISSLSSLLGFDFPQACVFVLDSEKDLSKTLTKIKENIDFLNDSPLQYAENVYLKDKTFTTWGKDFIAEILPKCSISYNFDNASINEFLGIIGVGAIADEKFYQK